MFDAPILSPRFVFEQADENFGPFDPTSLAPPPEFAAAKPRPIPATFRDGWYARNRRAGVAMTALMGLALSAVSLTGFSQRFGYLVLAGEYAGALGVALLAAAVIACIASLLVPARYQFVRRGDVVAARLLKVERYARGGTVPRFGYRMTVEYLEGTERQLATIDTGLHGLQGEESHYQLRVEAGDYLHLVQVDGGPLYVYGMLGLSADSDLLLRDGGLRRGGWPWKVGACLFGMLAMLVCLRLLFLALERYWPAQGAFSFLALSFTASAATGAVGAALAVILVRWRAPTADRERYRAAALLGFLCLGAAGFTAPLAINVLADHSEPDFEPVEVVKGVHTNGRLIHFYRLHYRERGGAGEKRYPCSPTHLHRFGEGGAAALELHPGALGWPWIREVHPVQLKPCKAGEGRFVKQIADEPQDAWFQPVLVRHGERDYEVIEGANAEWVWRTMVGNGVVILADTPRGS